MTGKSESQHRALLQLCEDLPQHLRAAHEVEGLIFAVCAAPQIPPPQQWMPWVLISAEDLQPNQAEQLTQVLMDSFKHGLGKMRDEGPLLPDICRYHKGLTIEDPLSQWMSGCLLGHQHLHSTWQQAWTAMQKHNQQYAPQAASELSHLLRLFSTFANVPLALQQAADKGNSGLAEQLDAIAQTLPRALSQYVALAGQLADYLPNQFETFVSGNPSDNNSNA